MIGGGLLWAMLGPRTLLVIAAVALALYGRSGVLKSRAARSLWPWPVPSRGRPAPAARRPTLPGDRTFWFLAILAASAVVAWVVTRTLILGIPGASH